MGGDYMPKVSTNINLDPDLKKSAQELFSDLGLDLTTAVTIFLKQSLKAQGLPFTSEINLTQKQLRQWMSFMKCKSIRMNTSIILHSTKQ